MRFPRFGIALLAGSLAALAVAGVASASTTGSGDVTKASVAFGVKFTGGKARAADSKLSPVVIGFVNQHGSTPAYPEYEFAADAAVKFINDKLGGIGGRPVKLAKCVVQTEEDGQRCAAELLANDQVFIANWSLGVNGNASFYKTVAGKFPVIVSVAASGADYTTPHVYELDGGGDSVLWAMALDAKRRKAKNVAIVSSDNPAGKFATGNILVPHLKSVGIKAKVVYVSDTAPTPDFVSALQAAGASTADLIMLIPPGAPQCISTYKALKQLQIKKTVIATYSCYGDPFPEATGGGAEGWDDWGLNKSQRIDDVETLVFKNVMAAYGQSKWIMIGSTPKTFGDILTIAKWANRIGVDKLTPAAFEKQILSWRGPAFMVPGNIACGKHPTYVGICGDSAAGVTYKAGKWVSLVPIKAAKLKP